MVAVDPPQRPPPPAAAAAAPKKVLHRALVSRGKVKDQDATTSTGFVKKIATGAVHQVRHNTRKLFSKACGACATKKDTNSAFAGVRFAHNG